MSLVQQALEQVDAACEQLGRNQVCYGNTLLDVTLREEDPDVSFVEPGDVAELVDVEAITVGPMITPDQWGIGVLSLLANLPGSLPGQNVTMVLIGDVQVTNEGNLLPELSPTEAAPDVSDDLTYGTMQAITLRTGIGRPQCAEAPSDGVLVQTPKGMARINLLVNQMQVELGSTVFVQAMWDDRMILATLDGSATATVGENTVEVPAGSKAEVPLDAEGVPSGEPQVSAYDPAEYAALLPFLRDILPEPVDAIAGTTAQAVTQVSEGRWQLLVHAPILWEGSCGSLPQFIQLRADQRRDVTITSTEDGAGFVMVDRQFGTDWAGYGPHLRQEEEAGVFRSELVEFHATSPDAMTGRLSQDPVTQIENAQGLGVALGECAMINDFTMEFVGP